jgi:hypothetical protein
MIYDYDDYEEKEKMAQVKESTNFMFAKKGDPVLILLVGRTD